MTSSNPVEPPDWFTGLTCSTSQFIKHEAENIQESDKWVAKLFKKTTDNSANWYVLSSEKTEYVQVYFVDGKLVLLNHASNSAFGGVGFKKLEKSDQIRLFVNLLKKLIEKKRADEQQPLVIDEIQLIGCDLNKKFAQQIADETGFCIKTLRNLHDAGA